MKIHMKSMKRHMKSKQQLLYFIAAHFPFIHLDFYQKAWQQGKGLRRARIKLGKKVKLSPKSVYVTNHGSEMI